jgi:predicted O-linked N-acetylglucosamine transferase (SPINDLY family)
MTLLDQAIAAHQRGIFTEAESLYRRILAANARDFDALHMLGILCAQGERFEEAAQYLRAALAVDSKFPPCQHNYGNVLAKLGRYREAIDSFKKVLALAPSFAPAYSDLGNAEHELGHFAAALASYDKALNLQPSFADAWLGRGNALCKLKRYDEALEAYDKALTLGPNSANAWLGRGNVFYALNRRDDAFACYDKALTLNPELANAWLGRANLLTLLERYEEALAAYDKVLALAPKLAEPWLGRGIVLSDLKRYADAVAACDRALALNPQLDYAGSVRLYAKQWMCDWTNLEAEIAQLLGTVKGGKLAQNPFAILTIGSSPADQLQCAKRYVQDQPKFPPLWQGEIYSHDRIRVAYLSADFHEHPVAHLTVGLFEQHDRSRFDVTAISFGPDQDSPMRRRLKGAFERFLDVADSTDQEIARLIRELEIDIAVDLMGFTQHSRFNVLARRPAPVQINYLGYAGTMGAPSIDYIIADETIIPADQRKFYTEQVVWLPESCLINDNRRLIPERTPTRRECGLPDTGFVFCCFNNSYKIAPDIFHVWMSLLKAVAGSVLWLGGINAAAQDNLRQAITQSGISPQRLIFAPRLPDIADHLARHRQADLFLDTLPYNAHTTASDALWAGLPVLTCIGPTFAGRVAASQLKAIGLEELITGSLDEYESLALRLANEPSSLASIKQKLTRNRSTSPLFDTQAVTRDIERAYISMWERHRKAGAPPLSIQGKPAR